MTFVEELLEAGVPLETARETVDRFIPDAQGQSTLDIGIFAENKNALPVFKRRLFDVNIKSLYLRLHNYKLREDENVQKNLAELLQSVENTSIPALKVKGVYLGHDGYLALDRALTNGKIASLNLQSSDLSQYTDLFAAAVKDTLLSSLSLPANQLDLESLETLGKAVGDLSSLEYLDIGRNVYLTGFECVLENLPENLKTLILSETTSPFQDMGFLARRLPKLELLQTLDLSLCRLSEESIITLSSVLPQTHLIRVNLSYNPMTAAGIKALAKALSRPDCLIFDTGLTNKESELDPKDIAEISRLERLNRAKIDTVYAKEVKEYTEFQSALKNAAQIKKAVKTADERLLKDGGLLFAAAKAGEMKAVFDRLKELGTRLNPEDYFSEDGFGKTLAYLAGNARQLDLIFAPENWNDPKKMQDVFDALPSRMKKQLDGKKGRPDFRNMKNEVVHNAVSVSKYAPLC